MLLIMKVKVSTKKQAEQRFLPLSTPRRESNNEYYFSYTNLLLICLIIPPILQF